MLLSSCEINNVDSSLNSNKLVEKLRMLAATNQLSISSAELEKRLMSGHYLYCDHEQLLACGIPKDICSDGWNDDDEPIPPACTNKTHVKWDIYQYYVDENHHYCAEEVVYTYPVEAFWYFGGK